jgi:hypothetical protein
VIDEPTIPRPRDRRPPRKRRRSKTPFVVGAALVLALAFGFALGQATHDNPKPGPPLTVEQTFVPTVTPLRP